ncbi:hypothetical protein GCM10010914_18150 [Deinococcus wulumuqiensis]|uniref:Uncharacterized protein n=1 Tax=Deinococcus wulumuqiensis TaxID=980427 RepID=A0AAV4K5J8_9DEIO|nr:hypothetical protein GCM10010914_18150 [Deinococcus wulumuqiensis]GGP29752.1 hypothetical protein GCM10008021_14030 [Deinococcus wulumuqiensis]
MPDCSTAPGPRQRLDIPVLVCLPENTYKMRPPGTFAAPVSPAGILNAGLHPAAHPGRTCGPPVASRLPAPACCSGSPDTHPAEIKACGRAFYGAERREKDRLDLSALNNLS